MDQALLPADCIFTVVDYIDHCQYKTFLVICKSIYKHLSTERWIDWIEDMYCGERYIKWFMNGVDIRNFESQGKQYVNCIRIHAEIDFYSLLLITAVRFDRIDLVKQILQMEHSDPARLLTTANNFYLTAISSMLYSRNIPIVQLFEQYIDKNRDRIRKRRRMSKETVRLLAAIIFSSNVYRGTNINEWFRNYIALLYDDDSVKKIYCELLSHFIIL